MQDIGITSTIDTGAGRVVLPAVEAGDATVVELHGEIDISMVEPLADSVAVGIERNMNVLIDLADVTLIDCAALNILVHAHRAADRRGRTVCLVAPPRLVRRILVAVGLDTTFPVVADRHEAVQELAYAPAARQ